MSVKDPKRDVDRDRKALAHIQRIVDDDAAWTPLDAATRARILRALQRVRKVTIAA